MQIDDLHYQQRSAFRSILPLRELHKIRRDVTRRMGNG